MVEHTIRELEQKFAAAIHTRNEADEAFNYRTRPDAMESVSLSEQAHALKYRAATKTVPREACETCERFVEDIANSGHLVCPKGGLKALTPDAGSESFVKVNVVRAATTEEVLALELEAAGRLERQQQLLDNGRALEGSSNEYYLVKEWQVKDTPGKEYTAGYTHERYLPRRAIYITEDDQTLCQPEIQASRDDGEEHVMEPSSLEYLAALMQKCEQGKPIFDSACLEIEQQVAAEPEGGKVKLVRSALKQTSRISMKAKIKYAGRYDKVLDIHRCLFVCDTTDGIMAIAKKLRRSKHFAKVKRGKNRLHRYYDATRQSGYRYVI